MPTLFDKEEILVTTPNKMVTLTTHRIYYQYKETGSSYYQSILLEHVTSCENRGNSIVVFLYLAFISFAFGLYMVYNSEQNAFFVSCSVGVLFLVFFALTRSSIILISSASTKMKIKTEGMKRETIINFLEAVEKAAIDRLNNLQN